MTFTETATLILILPCDISPFFPSLPRSGPPETAPSLGLNLAHNNTVRSYSTRCPRTSRSSCRVSEESLSWQADPEATVAHR